MKNPIYGTLFLLFTGIYTQAQTPGCTDANASNYSPAATVNDGSCLYPASNYAPVLVSELVTELNESSALLRIGSTFWTLGDSGNPANLYELDSLTGQVLRTVYIANAPNTDWEALTQNDTHLFVGDFGNNTGARQNLRVLKISKAYLVAGDTVTAGNIRFHYPEQTDFTPGNNNTDFDCEAFFFGGDSLHLFTKNWLSESTQHYTLPTDTGTHAAQLTETFDTDGLITDAATYGTHSVLLGYKNIGFGVYTCFLWLLSDYTNNHYFTGNKRRIEIGNALQLGQTEGICLHNDHAGHISSESIVNGTLGINEPAKLHRFDMAAYFPAPIHMGLETASDVEYTLYPNPASNTITLQVPINTASTFLLVNTQGQTIQQGTLQPGPNHIDISQLSTGTYFLYPNQAFSKKISFLKK